MQVYKVVGMKYVWFLISVRYSSKVTPPLTIWTLTPASQNMKQEVTNKLLLGMQCWNFMIHDLLVGYVLRKLDTKVWIVNVLFQSVAAPSSWKKLFCSVSVSATLLPHISYKGLKSISWYVSELCSHLDFKGFSLIMGTKQRTSAHFKQAKSRSRKRMTRFLTFASNHRSVHLDTVPHGKNQKQSKGSKFLDAHMDWINVKASELDAKMWWRWML